MLLDNELIAFARSGTELALETGGKTDRGGSEPVNEGEGKMTSATIVNESTRTGAEVKRGIGLPGRVVVSFTVAGGVLAGGFLVAAMTLAGKLSGNALLLTSGALYLMGAVLGFGHGAALGFFGRGEVSRREVVGKLGMAALYTIPLLAIGFIVAGWIAMTSVALYVGKVPALIGAGAGWLVGLVILLSAVAYGWTALRNAYVRWPQAQLGTVLVAATFAALLIVFLADRPMLWGLPFRVTEVGAVLLAWFASIWVGLPVVAVALKLIDRMPAPTPILNGQARSPWSGIVLGLAVGFVLSLIALPFYQPPIAIASPTTGTIGAVVVAVSQALLTEVLLRVFLVTAVIWLAMSWQNVKTQQAALVAVTLAALVQVVLYLPGVLALGLPSWMATIGYVMAAVLVPGLAFGALYVKRGLTAALAGHAAALIALALLA